MNDKEVQILIDTIGGLLRQSGIWVLPEAITELKDGILKIDLKMFPKHIIEKDNKIPTQTLLRTKYKGEESRYCLYKIPKTELEKYNLEKKKGDGKL